MPIDDPTFYPIGAQTRCQIVLQKSNGRKMGQHQHRKIQKLGDDQTQSVTGRQTGFRFPWGNFFGCLELYEFEQTVPSVRDASKQPFIVSRALIDPFYALSENSWLTLSAQSSSCASSSSSSPPPSPPPPPPPAW